MEQPVIENTVYMPFLNFSTLIAGTSNHCEITVGFPLLAPFALRRLQGQILKNSIDHHEEEN